MSDHPVRSTHFPYLPVTITVRHRTATVEALVDTGFDGDVVVPAALISDGTAPDLFVHWRLADGSRVRAPVYIGTVQLGHFAPVPGLMSVLGDEPIVGRSFTDRFRVILDHGEQVLVEP